jgi:ubiquinone/menaquinone biosynthesis C-methylase UbiE
MGLHDWFYATNYNRFMASTEQAGLADHRARLLDDARGDVLEVGAGTGLNLRHYSGLGSLTLTEPMPAMVRRLKEQAGQSPLAPTVVRAPAEDLPFDDDSFDTVVATLVLCSVDDQPRALREAHRVLRPGGRLLFLEHVRSDDPRLARKQDRVNWLNRMLVHCDCNRPTVSGVTQAGFTVDRLERSQLPKAPAFIAPMVIGRASVSV